jgi:hypothetical protein
MPGELLERFGAGAGAAGALCNPGVAARLAGRLPAAAEKALLWRSEDVNSANLLDYSLEGAILISGG